MINYQLTYSESYSGMLNGAPPIIIVNFRYVTLLLAALILFSWIIYTVAIYCLPSGRYKVFDSHSMHVTILIII